MCHFTEAEAQIRRLTPATRHDSDLGTSTAYRIESLTNGAGVTEQPTPVDSANRVPDEVKTLKVSIGCL